jgi:subtilisin
MTKARSARRSGAALLATIFLFFCHAAVGAGTTSLIVVFSSATDGERDGREILATPDLNILADWPLVSLDVYCFEVSAGVPGRLSQIKQRLEKDPRVAAVQWTRAHRVAGRPFKDPYFDLQARTRSGGVASVLNRGSGRGVRVAVIDTGVDLEHPDLEGQISVSMNFVANSTEDPVPAEFHGTSVVGLISATPSNGIGIHGLAPDAELLALRACWEPAYGYGLCSTNTLALALDYAIEARAHIINLSLAGPEDRLLTRLVNRAVELGAVVFGAVGEDSTQSFPASNPNVIAVEQGPGHESAALGPYLAVPGLQLLSTVPDARYDFVSGSSFATAHASGIAAVMLEQQPHLRTAELVTWLRDLHGNADQE